MCMTVLLKVAFTPEKGCFCGPAAYQAFHSLASGINPAPELTGGILQVICVQ
jgi:hypothetical protein